MPGLLDFFADPDAQEQMRQRALALAQQGARGVTTGVLSGFGTVDLANMLMGGAGGDAPVMGSKWIGDKLASAGLLAPAPTDAAGTAMEMGGSLVNPGGLLGAGAKGLAIVSPMVARTLKTRAVLPADETFSAAVANTPGAQITPEGLLMRVQRSQMPEQAQQESVRGGVFYLPEGAQQAKHYSTGKSGYGGPEKMSGETLVANPLFAKGGTGGKAPERAYDSLQGKGAYQAMRDDALHWSGGPRDIRNETVSKFLDKYAPELANYADYIIENSGKGNQLAYALQEAAVASAARNAGHDAVVGYSKGKNGPFISELFDVRESHYPDKFGYSRIWDQFRPGE